MTHIQENGNGALLVQGAMTHDSARSLLEMGRSKLSAQETLFDLSAVDEVDSSCLAIIFGWQRAAEAAGRVVRIISPPSNLVSLAALYGVSELLPLA